MKTYPTLLFIKEIQIKRTIKLYFMPTRMIKILKGQKQINVFQGLGEKDVGKLLIGKGS